VAHAYNPSYSRSREQKDYSKISGTTDHLYGRNEIKFPPSYKNKSQLNSELKYDEQIFKTVRRKQNGFMILG
jgi:hypothetical protein